MEILRIIIELLEAIIWPAIVISILLVFRKPLIERLKNVREFEFRGFKFKIEKIDAIQDETISAIEDTLNDKQLDEKSKLKFIQDYVADQFERIKESGESAQGSDLRSDNKHHTLVAFTANDSRHENLIYNIYYDPVDRNHNRRFDFIGLYAQKEIFAIGEVTKVVYCDLIDNELVPTNGTDLKGLSIDEKARIVDTIRNTEYYDLRRGHKFFIVKQFYNTHFKKRSFSSLRGKKYFWLNEFEEYSPAMDAEQIAKC